MALHESMVQFRSRCDALGPNDISSHTAVGCELPHRVGERSSGGRRSGAIVRRDLCCKYGRLGNRRTRIQSRTDPFYRHARFAPGVDRPLDYCGRCRDRVVCLGCPRTDRHHRATHGDTAGRNLGGYLDTGIGSGFDRFRHSVAGYRLRPPRRADFARYRSILRSHTGFRERRNQLVSGDHGSRRSAILLRQRQIGGFVGAPGHASSASWDTFLL